MSKKFKIQQPYGYIWRTGDLTHRKLMPALYNLVIDNLLPRNFAVVAIGRREKTDEQYRNEVLRL